MSNAVQARSLGQHLAQRLQEVGCDRFFGVPGDYNLSVRTAAGQAGAIV
jgi:TPP-dependent 2-oxoacid decarboxylase